METTPQNTDQRENPAIPSPPALCAVLSCRDPRSGDPQCPFYCSAHLRMWREGDKRGLLAALHGDLDVEVGG